MSVFSVFCVMQKESLARLGLIALQVDATSEQDFRHLFWQHVARLHFASGPFSMDMTPDVSIARSSSAAWGRSSLHQPLGNCPLREPA